MTAPISNANLTSPASPDTRNARVRGETGNTDKTPATGSRDDAATVVKSPAPPAPDNGLDNLAQAKALLASTKQLLAASPGTGIAAHGGIDASSVAGSLHQVA